MGLGDARETELRQPGSNQSSILLFRAPSYEGRGKGPFPPNHPGVQFQVTTATDPLGPFVCVERTHPSSLGWTKGRMNDRAAGSSPLSHALFLLTVKPEQPGFRLGGGVTAQISGRAVSALSH